MATLTEQSRFDMGYPAPDQLALINKFRPQGTPSYESTEVLTVAFRASDNLLSHSYSVWSESSLITMAERFPGKPVIRDHEWEEVEETVGFIYDTEIIKTASAPPDLLDNIDPEINRQIVRKYGYIQLFVFAAIEAIHPVVNDLRYRRASNVSTGGFVDNDYQCPICDTGFDDPRCPHYMPNPNYQVSLEEMGVEPELVAPYYIRGNWVESVELSLVVSGNIPNARLI